MFVQCGIFYLPSLPTGGLSQPGGQSISRVIETPTGIKIAERLRRQQGRLVAGHVLSSGMTTTRAAAIRPAAAACPCSSAANVFGEGNRSAYGRAPEIAACYTKSE